MKSGRPKLKTSKNLGHRHKYKPGNKYTEMNMGHKHRIWGKRALASKTNNHYHRLLKQ